jgi:hypothetical protein
MRLQLRLPSLRLLPRSLAFLLFAALAALTCDDAQPPVRLAEQLAQAFCTHQLSCCSPYELALVTSDRYKDQDECVRFATVSARQQLAAVDASLAQGRISVDPAGLEACLQANSQGACNVASAYPTPVSPLPNLAIALAYCPKLFVGHVPYNQPCGLSIECAPGSRCLPGPPGVAYGYPGLPDPVSLLPSSGLCIPYQQVGETCNDSGDCDRAHACHENRLRPLRGSRGSRGSRGGGRGVS